MVYHHYYKPSRVYYQQGHGLGSLIARFALPALRKLAPIVKSAVKTHGKRVIRKVGRAALKSAQAKNKKAVFKREMARAVAREIRKNTKAKPKPKSKPKRPKHKVPTDIFP